MDAAWATRGCVHIAYGGNAAVAARARANLPDTGWSGFVEQVQSPADFREACFLAAQHDLRLHTIVSDSLHEIVPVLEAVNAKHPLAGRRWVIEHVARASAAEREAIKVNGKRHPQVQRRTIRAPRSSCWRSLFMA